MQHIDPESISPVTHLDEKTEDNEEDESEDADNIPHSTLVEVAEDFPPESFWLSKDAEFDWFDRNAFLERKESTKGNTNSTYLNNNHIVNPTHSNSSSQRYSVSLKSSKATIIGLPKTQNTSYLDSKRRLCKPVNVRMFPTTVLVTEPTSPKVSCIGRVRSKRCRSRRKLSKGGNEHGSQRSSSQRSGKSGSTSKVNNKNKFGLLSRITSLFRSEGRRRGKNSKSLSGKVLESNVPMKICVSVKQVNTSSEPATPTGPAGLGGMIRFASGRRF